MFFQNNKLETKAKEIADLGTKIINMQQDVNSNRNIITLLLDHIPALVFFKDLENRITYINRFGIELYGLPKEKLLGHEWTKGVPEDKLKQYFDNDMDVIRTGKPKTKIRETLSNNSDLWFDTLKIPIFEDGRVIGLMGYSTPITED